MVYDGVHSKITESGNMTLVYEQVMEKVYERFTGMIDDTLYDYLGIAKEQVSGNNDHSNMSDLDLAQSDDI
jgi:hypothetical protein